MKKDPRIRNAIDENLSSVHFDVSDMHSVLRSVRHQSAPRRASARKKRMPLQLILATTMAVLVIAPLSILALRAQSARTSITTITAHGAQTDSTAAAPDEDPIALTPAPSTPAGALSESDVIAAARACFEANCDTDIFQFDEYTVDVQLEAEYSDNPSAHHYVVTMNSIYDNGCTFRVVISAQSGEVISYSTPRLATVPARLDSASPEIQAWYDKYGAHLFTWPLEIQAEFSRRYEGGMLRTPREGELDAAAISRKLSPHYETLIETCQEADCTHHSVQYYPMLYSERAFADGQARYQVYCFLGDEASDSLPDVCMLLTFLAADGTLESKEILSTDGL